MGIADYSTTAANNTSINGINIAEGWPAANINNSIRQLMADVAADAVTKQAPTSTGSANAYVVTLAPVPSSYTTGLRFDFVASFDNDDAATINVNSLGAKSIYKKDTSGVTAMAGGEIKTGQVVSVVYDGTQFQMLDSPEASSAMYPVVSAETLEDARTELGVYGISDADLAFAPLDLTPRVPKIQIFTSSGTYTPSEGLISSKVVAVGAGGGGGGAASTGSSQASAGGGGGAGQIITAIISASDIGASKSITIGAAGVGASGSTAGVLGTSGGDTSFGSLVVAKGGVGGSTGSASTYAGIYNGDGGAGGSGGTVPSGGLSIAGAMGEDGVLFSGYCPSAGDGGGGSYGAGGKSRKSFSGYAGKDASGYGAGGSGANNGPSLSAKAGGNGTQGIIIIEEYCNQ